ncbi:MAG TPA: hypothetical protein VFU02_15530 [Polyangiaceae bacterium]|nr:hypothetical protein [Polyangiaceae bacterium]
MLAPGARSSAVLLVASLCVYACGAAPNTNRFVVVDEPAERPYASYCERACRSHLPAGASLVDCRSVRLEGDVGRRLNRDNDYGVACEFR